MKTIYDAVSNLPPSVQNFILQLWKWLNINDVYNGNIDYYLRAIGMRLSGLLSESAMKTQKLTQIASICAARPGVTLDMLEKDIIVTPIEVQSTQAEVVAKPLEEK